MVYLKFSKFKQHIPLSIILLLDFTQGLAQTRQVVLVRCKLHPQILVLRQGLAMDFRLSLNSRSSFLCLWRTGITGLCQHAWHHYVFDVLTFIFTFLLSMSIYIIRIIWLLGLEYPGIKYKRKWVVNMKSFLTTILSLLYFNLINCFLLFLFSQFIRHCELYGIFQFLSTLIYPYHLFLNLIFVFIIFS
jgi:hypothetical protein